ncbi:RNA-directed DNA polymerase, eukaryota, reverse transcriptase zinc-binding domain protein [Tanacetum coccineum]
MAALNVRGICNKDMQKEVRSFIKNEKLSICASLETHVKERKLQRICGFVYDRWRWVSNMKDSDKSCRIIERKEASLEDCLGRCKGFIKDKPWVLMGDWNVSLNIKDHSEGGSYKTNDMIDFQECLGKIKVKDLNCSGIHFTWVQSRQNPNSGILKKIDRVLGNVEFMNQFTNSHATFLQHLSSDHKPAILVIPEKKKEGEGKNGISKSKNFLGKAREVRKFDLTKLNSKTISNKDAEAMVKSVSDVEVKAALFDIYDNKSPRPYGYSAKFYKKAWTIIGRDVCNVVKEFFKNGEDYWRIQEKTQLSRIKCMSSLRATQSQLKFLTDTLQDFGNMPIFKRTFSQDLDLLEQHLTKEIISQTACKTTLTKLRTTFENAFSLEIKARMQNYTRYDAQSFYDAMIFNMDSLKKYMLELILHQQ